MASPATKLSTTVPYTAEASFDGNQHGRERAIGRRKTARRQWPLVVADLAWIASGGTLAVALRFHSIISISPTPYPLIGHTCIIACYAVLVVLLCHFQGLYSLDEPLAPSHEVSIVAKSIAIGTILLGSILFVSGVKSTSRLVIIVIAFYALLSMSGWRLFRRWSLGKADADGVFCHNVLIVGTDVVALALAEHLNQHRQLGYRVVGHLGPAISSVNTAEVEQSEIKVLGDSTELKSLCRKHFADEVIICSRDRSMVMQAIADARECQMGVRVVPDLYDGVAFGAHLQYLGGFPTFAVVLRSIPAVSMRLKRGLDLVVASTVLVLLGAFLLILAAIIKLTSPGPVLYKSLRVGKKGKAFYCLKFRTMVADAEKRKAELSHLNERNGVLFKISNDPRVTAVGRFLREYSLDELPQLWNVIKGDMSLVGPRPPLLSEVEQYRFADLRRLEVAPGITGLWQVEARNHPSFDRYISLDLHYIENWTLVMDLSILLRTIGVVFAGTGK